jgi:hypothetical protein
MSAQTTEATSIPARRGRRTKQSPAAVAESNTPSGRTTTPRVVHQPAPASPAQKAAATRAAKAAEVKKQSEALAKELESRPAPKPAGKPAKEPRVTGHRQWATKPVTPAMLKFSTWIEREFPELGKVTGDRDQRLIMIASKAYTAFQSSDLNDN